MINYHDYIQAVLVGFLGLWITFALLGAVQIVRGSALQQRVVHSGWSGYSVVAGFGYGVALVAHGQNEDMVLFSQILLGAAWPSAFIWIAVKCLTIGPNHSEITPELSSWGWGPKWKSHLPLLFLASLISTVVTLIGWWIERGGISTSFFALVP